MPELSRFFGIVVQMFYDDHAPPHFHAKYGSHRVVVGLDDLAVLKGVLPPRALGCCWNGRFSTAASSWRTGS